MLTRRQISQFISDKYVDLHFKFERKYKSDGEATWNIWVKGSYKPFETLEELAKLIEEKL